MISTVNSEQYLKSVSLPKTVTPFCRTTALPLGDGKNITSPLFSNLGDTSASGIRFPLKKYWSGYSQTGAGDGDGATGDGLGTGDGDALGDGTTGDGDALGDGGTGDGDALGDGTTGDGDALGDG